MCEPDEPDDPDPEDDDSPYEAITDPAQRAFLVAYQRTGSITRAARAAGVAPKTVRRWRAMHPDFAMALMIAEEEYRDAMLAPLIERGLNGWDEPLMEGNRIIGHMHRYDSKALLHALALLNPEEFGHIVNRGKLSPGERSVLARRQKRGAHGRWSKEPGHLISGKLLAPREGHREQPDGTKEGTGKASETNRARLD